MRNRAPRRLTIIMSSLALVMSLNVSSNTAASGSTGLLFGAYAPPGPMSGMTSITTLEQAIGRRLDVVLFYQAWGSQWSYFNQDWIAAPASGGRRVLLRCDPWLPNGSANQPAFALRNILLGKYDSYIKSWARGLKSYGGTVYLRPMHEMNGNWYPWGGRVNGNTPLQYRRSWRYLHGIFAQIGATNVRWVWSPYAQDVPSDNRFEQYFPGSQYVDVLALDGYNWGQCKPAYGGWRSFGKVFRGAYDRIVQLAAKPVWIAETASAPEGGDKALWVKNMFSALPTAFPRIKAVVWFHMDKECDWRLTSPPEVTTTVASSLRMLA